MLTTRPPKPLCCEVNEGSRADKTATVILTMNSFPPSETLCYFCNNVNSTADAGAQLGLRRGPSAARLMGCRFESRRGHVYLSLVSVVCCQVEVSACG